MINGLPGRVRQAPRMRTTVTSCSLVLAELAGSREAVRLRGASQWKIYSHTDVQASWYMDWQPTGHTRWLTTEDFDRLKVARWAAPVALSDPDGRKMFARKFRSSDATILDWIDDELRR